MSYIYIYNVQDNFFELVTSRSSTEEGSKLFPEEPHGPSDGCLETGMSTNAVKRSFV